ncbi:MAG TPA: tripartite tricarboxylate transporter substrate-binding protein [Xanthobacteraceae bacterium]|nr:tripartite tricarboxylate transporter substrate-binding protein [Xanthobacteraceae bacterium]
MSKSGRLGGSLVSVCAMLACSTGATADVADFYKGKTVTIIVGYPPGGGYDAYARALTRHMGRHIPGNPTVLMRNMPGAGSLVAANHIYNSAPKDGTALGMFASSTLFSVKMGETKAQFEMDKFTWIGNMDQTIGTCVVSAASKINSFQELFTKSAIFGASGPTAVNSTHARAFNALFGTRIQVVNGYPGSTHVLLAMSRGEVQGGCGFALSSLKTTRRQDWESGEIKPIIQTGFEKSDELKGVPHIYDFAKSEDDKKIMHVIYGTHALGRPISGPPGIPADRAEALRNAFNATMTDPEFLAEARKQDMPIASLTGEQTEKFIAQFANYPSAVYDRAMKILEAGEVVNVKLKVMEGSVTNVANGVLTVNSGTGTPIKLEVDARETSVTIAGTKSKASDLKEGMSCRFEYFGENDLAPKADCK